jgi:hypothetical protein
MPTAKELRELATKQAAEQKAAETKVPVGKTFGGHVSTSTGGSVTEEDRITIEDAIKGGIEFSKVMYTKIGKVTIDGVERDGGGKPFVYAKLPADIIEEFNNIQGDSVAVWFHESAKELLAEVGKLSKRMDWVEVYNETLDEYSFLLTGRGSNISTSKHGELGD